MATRAISAAGKPPVVGGHAGGDVNLRRDVVVGESDPNVTYGSVRVATSASVPTWKRGRPINFLLMMRIHRMRLSLIILMTMSYLMHTCWMTESLMITPEDKKSQKARKRVYSQVD